MIFEDVPKFIGLSYAVVVIIMLALMVRKQKFTGRVGLILLVISTGFGFLFFAPMMPYSFQLLILRDLASLGIPFPMASVGLLLVLMLTFVFGRFFCGYVCPIGAAQELMSRLPVKNRNIGYRKTVIVVHLFFFVLFIVMGIFFSVNMLSLFGISDFFNLNFTPFFVLIFVLLLLLSIVVYRPFCRFVCPYGLLLSLAAYKSVFQLKRNDDCIDCDICEKHCPTDEATVKSFKQECYLCMKCSELCPKDGISFEKRGE